jgi:hypothetical protein
VKLQLLAPNDFLEFVSELLQFRATVIAIILHSCRNYCDKPTRWQINSALAKAEKAKLGFVDVLFLVSQKNAECQLHPGSIESN